jgi:signal transduction histidine kinase
VRLLGRVLRAPVTARPWRELAYFLVTLVPALLAFALAVLGLVGAVLSLLTVGLPVLVAALSAARLTGRVFRVPARGILRWEWASPHPIRGRGGPIGWARAVLRDDAAWGSLLYCFLKLPLTVAACYLGGVTVIITVLALTYPAWWFVTPTGWGLLDHHSWAGSWLFAAEGVAVALAWPWLLRLLAGIERFLIRALLEPNRDRTRIAALESSRALLTADSTAVLRGVERNLHDGTQARLVMLGVALGRIEHRVSDPEVRALVADAQRTVTDALTELRDIVRGIHPPALDAGLPTAIATLAARSPVPVEASVELTGTPSDATAAAVYFSATELLTNAARHAGATRVRLHLTDRGSALRLVVDDDGRGGAVADGAGTGLRGLARRAAALDGTLDVVSPPGGPTAVTLTLPKEA